MRGWIVLGVVLSLTSCASEVSPDERRSPEPMSVVDSTGGPSLGYGGSICDGAGSNVKVNGVEFRMPVFCRDDYVYMGDPPPKNRVEPGLPNILPVLR